MTARPDAGAEQRPLTIEKLVPGGDGMAHLADGRVAFVPGAFPGDVVQPAAIEARKGHVRVARWALLRPSEDRVAPPCAVAAECGGCDWMALSPAAQLRAKETLLRDALARTGGLTQVPPETRVTASPGALRYRNRVRFHVAADGAIGFHGRGTHDVVAVPGCVACRPEIDDALRALRTVARAQLAALSEIEVRCADDGATVSIRLVARFPGGAGPALRAVVTRMPADWSVTLSDDAATEGGVQRYPLPGGVSLHAAPGVFTQVNWGVNVALVQAVLAGAASRGAQRFLDAYAGAGNFSLPLLAAGMSGVSVERDARAVECGRRAARAAGLSADGFVAADAGRHVARLVREREQFDLVLLDPPRSGARDVIPSVVALRPPTIACCSCDPVTLSRDLSSLLAAGYRLEEVQGFDMFPGTHHLEALAWLSLGK